MKSLMSIEKMKGMLVCMLSLFLSLMGPDWAHAQYWTQTEEDMKQLVVVVHAQFPEGDHFGSGIVVGRSKGAWVVVTANHVVRRGDTAANTVSVQFKWDSETTVHAILEPHYDPKMDVALLTIPIGNHAGIDLESFNFNLLGEPGYLRRGDPLFMLGHPLGKTWRVNTTAEKFSESRGDLLEFESNLIAVGHSGGALLNNDRKLIGLLRTDQAPYGEAVNIFTVLNMIKQWGFPVHLHSVGTHISVRGDTTCWLGSEGHAKCWGGDPAFPVNGEMKEITFKAISAGRTFVCGLSHNGSAYCLGNNHNGQLGNGISGENSYFSSTQRVISDEIFDLISAGFGQACALAKSGHAFCWGWGEGGQLGNGTGKDSATPVRVAGDLRFKDIETGWYHGCGITVEDKAYCWGGIKGLGIPRGGSDPPNAFVPVPVEGPVLMSSISVGFQHQCGLTSQGKAYCWGFNDDGELGTGTSTASDDPAPVSGDLVFKALTAGYSHTCGLTTQGVAYCWGNNHSGKLGTGTREPMATPTKVAGNHEFIQISAGAIHTCGLTTEESLYCWGDNRFGQLGVTTVEESLVPLRIEIQ